LPLSQRAFFKVAYCEIEVIWIDTRCPEVIPRYANWRRGGGFQTEDFAVFVTRSRMIAPVANIFDVFPIHRLHLYAQNILRNATIASSMMLHRFL
jgi:hypothetical protein